MLTTFLMTSFLKYFILILAMIRELHLLLAKFGFRFSSAVLIKLEVSRVIWKCAQNCLSLFAFFLLLCCPVFSPHSWGGDWPPGFVTENTSVKHWVAWVAATPLALVFGVTWPLMSFVATSADVEGPFTEKLSKSSRNLGDRRISARSVFGYLYSFVPDKCYYCTGK